MLPVRDVLIVANKLQQRFSSCFEKVGYKGRTASCGIALFHHLQPLEWALRAVRQAVERAKETPYDRAALVVDFLRRSGERVSVGMKWNYRNLNTMNVMKDVQDAIVSGDLSGRIGYDVLDVAPVLIGQKRESTHRIQPEARKAELQRLFKRRAGDTQEAKEKAKHIGENIAHLIELMQVHGEKYNPIEEIARWLILMRFITQGEDV